MRQAVGRNAQAFHELVRLVDAALGRLARGQRALISMFLGTAPPRYHARMAQERRAQPAPERGVFLAMALLGMRHSEAWALDGSDASGSEGSATF